ncbi:MAG: hypothetical protein R2777_01420 [Chitinophagales bacterium]
MKKIVLIALAVLSIQCTFAQKKNKKQKIKDQHFQVDTSKLNELELDVTNLLKVAVVSSGYEGYYFSSISSPYLLTYRRYIGNFDIHTGFGIGGSKISNVRNDTITRDSKNFDFSYEMGLLIIQIYLIDLIFFMVQMYYLIWKQALMRTFLTIVMKNTMTIVKVKL